MCVCVCVLIFLQKTDVSATTENEPTDQTTTVGLANEEDLTLRVSMYSVVLQVHTDMVSDEVMEYCHHTIMFHVVLV